MSAAPLVIVTTRLPPATCGIGTYSWLLREHWPNESAPVEFLVIDDIARAGASSTADRVTAFHGRGDLLEDELNRIGDAPVLLHYAGRAYQRFGIPLWMPGVFARWKCKFPQARLTVYVHELPGDFAVTSRHFWLDQLNSWIIRRLATIAGVMVTNSEAHARKLRKISGCTDVHVVPVGSNIEGESVQPMSRVRTEFAIFGLPFGRWQTLRLFDAHLPRWLAVGSLTKLHIIGPDGDAFSREADELIRAWPDPAVAIRHGVLPAPEVARLLCQVGFALTNATSETWSKSTTFMACVENHCPIVRASTAAETGVFSNTVSVDEVGTISESELERRAATLADWYKTNAAWPVTAARIAALMES